jgi:hypothetical protein
LAEIIFRWQRNEGHGGAGRQGKRRSSSARSCSQALPLGTLAIGRGLGGLRWRGHARRATSGVRRRRVSRGKLDEIMVAMPLERHAADLEVAC